jgi:hypothetical protein
LASAWADDRAKSEGPVDADCPSPGELSPPVHRLISTLASSKEGLKRFTVIVKMDRAHPLTEAKWVRSGNADEWIQSVVGNSSSASSASTQSGRAAQQLPKGEQGSSSNTPLAASHSSRSSEVSRESAWKGKIRVVDPDAVRFSISLHLLFLFPCQMLTLLLFFLFISPTSSMLLPPFPSLSRAASSYPRIASYTLAASSHCLRPLSPSAVISKIRLSLLPHVL